ncbi:unnamed protein product [Caenorhabditis auriculariae]|uniref:Uncharacterized protein n=1 Tax=Caenorhabditis auriculariae TaxID=2777116 RepID=A0A8S1H946_9PELO|nr:unnamed protein product [Caenorhabditis auriculariae]
MSMRDERRRLLDVNLLTLTAELEVDDVLLHLRARRVFTEDIADRIQSQRTARDRRIQLVRLLKTRGDSAFEVFYEALVLTEQMRLASLLEPMVDREAVSKIRGAAPSMEFEQGNCLYSPIRTRSRSRGRPVRTLGVSDRFNQNYCMETSLPGEENLMNGMLPWGTEPQILTDLGVEYCDAPFIERIFDPKKMYPNFAKPRGLCLVVNNERFDTMPHRQGTNVDKQNISTLFKTMGYDIIEKNNVTVKELTHLVRAFGQDSRHKHAQSAVVVILSHGEHEQIIGVDDNAVSTHRLFELLNASNAPLLAKKPKLWFIQACRGERRDLGFATLDEVDGAPRREFDGGDGPFNFFNCVRPQIAQQAHIRVPNEADVMVAYATTPQFVSWRNSLRGSWFIQAICEIFAAHAKDEDVLTLMTMVNHRVAMGYQTQQRDGTCKQMPEITSRLLKKFYFWPVRSSGSAV